jgi:hypothetical protein
MRLGLYKKRLSQCQFMVEKFIYFFIYSVFNNTVTTQTIVSNDWFTANKWTGKDLEGSSCHMTLIYYPIISLEWLWKTTTHFIQESQCPGPDLNWASSAFKLEALPLELTSLVRNLALSQNEKELHWPN